MLKPGNITCTCCSHHCSLAPHQTGLCRARKNTGSSIECINYGYVTSLSLDPIEKKPLFRFMGGHRILSVGSFGCNLYCPFCQNHSISQRGFDRSECDLLTPEELCALAIKLKESDGNIGVAFTYNEPLTGFEYVRDCARLLKKNDLNTVLVTNGSFTEDVLNGVLPYIDAMNIDLKGFKQDIYDVLGGDLMLVKDFIKNAYPYAHIELTSLIVPSLNSSVEDMRAQSEWIASISPEIPLHITRYFPNYRMTDPPTSIPHMKKLIETAQKYLSYVYPGNI